MSTDSDANISGTALIAGNSAAVADVYTVCGENFVDSFCCVAWLDSLARLVRWSQALRLCVCWEDWGEVTKGFSSALFK